MHLQGAGLAGIKVLTQLLKRAEAEKSNGNPSSQRVGGRGQGSGSTMNRDARSGKQITHKKRSKKRVRLSIKQRVSQIEKDAKEHEEKVTSVRTTKIASSSTINSTQNEANYQGFEIGTLAQVIAVGTALPLITVSTAAGAAVEESINYNSNVFDSSQGLDFRFIHTFYVRNNEPTPLLAWFYELAVNRKETSYDDQTPQEAIAIDQTAGAGNSGFNDIMYSPNAGIQFRNNFKIVQTTKVFMQPGDEFRTTLDTGWFSMSPREVDAMTAQGARFMPEHTRHLLVRHMGRCITSTADADVGWGTSSLNIIRESIAKVRYPDLSNGNYQSSSNLLDTIAAPQEFVPGVVNAAVL